jgi:hypothetical protein
VLWVARSRTGLGKPRAAGRYREALTLTDHYFG